MRRSKSAYPPDWPEIALQVKADSGWRCVRCGVAHGPVPNVLTVHHANLDPADCEWFNLLALCQRCHLSVQGRVDLDRPWVLLDHSDWFRPYVAGHYARRYLGVVLTRPEVERRLDELLALERRAVLGEGVA